MPERYLWPLLASSVTLGENLCAGKTQTIAISGMWRKYVQAVAITFRASVLMRNPQTSALASIR